MAKPTQHNWYPQPTGNHGTDETNRIAFDHIYQLRERLDKAETAKPPAAKDGIYPVASVAVVFAPGPPATITVNGKSVTKLNFANGRLVSWS